MKKNKKKKTEWEEAAVYVRVSHDEQLSVNSESQKERCIDYGVAKRLNVWGGHIYIDTASTTYPASKRKELRDLLKAARAGEFEHVIVYRFDRLSRKTPELLDVLETFRELDIKVHSATEPIDFETPSGKTLLTILSNITMFERNGCGGRCNE